MPENPRYKDVKSVLDTGKLQQNHGDFQAKFELQIWHLALTSSYHHVCFSSSKECQLFYDDPVPQNLP